MKSRETPTLAGKVVNVDVYSPAPTPLRGAVVVAYGTEGMNSPFDALIEHFCKATESEGYLTVLPYYFESTGTVAGVESVTLALGRSGAWIDTLAAAVDWAKAKVGGGKCALVGFSLGANMVLNAASKSTPAAVVDYFGPVDRFGIMPMPTVAQLNKPRVKNLPPTMIHHGNKDSIVPDTQSKLLKGWLDDHGVSCTFMNNYACGHPGQPDFDWTVPARDASTVSTLGFLKMHI